jgi:succinate dehydrogenase / fumarate reductase membrane anchor subunit
MKDYLGSSRSGLGAWWFQRVSGLALAVILLLHFFVLHYLTGGPLTYQAVMTRLAHPWWKTLDILFVVLGLTHAASGFNLLIDDYVHRPGWRQILIGLNWLVCSAFMILGVVTILGLRAPG